MEEELDEVASGKRAWVPVVRAFYQPFRTLVDTKTKELRRRDFTTRSSDEVCSLGHPMVVRLGRYGEFLACSTYPEHKETRELPGADGGTSSAGTSEGGEAAPAEACPKCGEAEGGVLVQRRGRFGPFMGCSRYPACDYIKREGPPPPDPLAFEVACPKCKQGRLTTRRARRTGSLFWGCSRYPKCDYTTSHEPVGAVHDADEGPIGRAGEGALCLACGAPVGAAGGRRPRRCAPGRGRAQSRGAGAAAIDQATGAGRRRTRRARGEVRAGPRPSR